jgi:hypothetical protein
MRNPTSMCSLTYSGLLSYTPIETGTGYIYVPSALVDQYKAATNWSTYASQIRAIEDYPDVCGYPATSVADNEYEGASLTMAYFPECTTIGKSAFKDCTSLTTADFPKATSIGENAFAHCTSLTIADFPAATNIGNYTFDGCTSLTSVDFPKATNIVDSAFRGCTSLMAVNFPNATRIENYAFINCTSLTIADFPNVTRIGNYAFYNCTKLAVLILRNTDSICTKIGTPFTSTPIETGTGYIYVPAALIDQYKADAGWSTYASQIRAIEDYPEICTNNFSIISITNNAYKGSDIVSANFLAATTIGNSAFQDCTALKTAYLPVVEDIGYSAFKNCSLLETVEMPAVITIGGDAFSKCTSLRKIDIPSCVAIKPYAFGSCTALNIVVLRSETKCTFEEGSSGNPFGGTPLYSAVGSGDGYIYVPRALVEDYKADAVLSVYKNKIRALEDYTVDGTTTGALDESKI